MGELGFEPRHFHLRAGPITLRQNGYLQIGIMVFLFGELYAR